MTETRYFLAYASHDLRYAHLLYDHLRDAGVDLFFDRTDLRPGEPYRLAEERALKDSRGLIVLLSPDSVSSDEVMSHVSFALDTRKHVIPVLVRQCGIPPRLRRIQRLDFTDTNGGAFQHEFERLLASVGVDGPAIRWRALWRDLISGDSAPVAGGPDAPAQSPPADRAEDVAASAARPRGIAPAVRQDLAVQQPESPPVSRSSIFLCYSHTDDEFAHDLARRLVDRGLDLWVDQRRIDYGDDWNRHIDRAIRECGHFLIVLSPGSVGATEVLGELHLALKLKKKIVPVVYQECEVPRQLLLTQHVDFRRTDADGFAKRLERLVRALSPAGHERHEPG